MENKSTKILATVMVCMVLLFIGLTTVTKIETDKRVVSLKNEVVDNDKHLALVKSECRDNVITLDDLKKKLYDNMHEAFRVKLIYIVRTMQPKLDKVIATKIVKHIIEESEAHGLDPVLIAALMWTESRFDPFARSKKNAIGLMQVRYSVWKKTPVMLKNGARKEGSLFWIDINIKVGAGIFKEYYDKSNHNVAKTLWRYNSGQTKFPKGKRSYDVTYVNKVLIKAYEIKEMLKESNSDKKAKEEHKQ